MTNFCDNSSSEFNVFIAVSHVIIAKIEIDISRPVSLLHSRSRQVKYVHVLYSSRRKSPRKTILKIKIFFGRSDSPYIKDLHIERYPLPLDVFVQKSRRSKSFISSYSVFVFYWIFILINHEPFQYYLHHANRARKYDDDILKCQL